MEEVDGSNPSRSTKIMDVLAGYSRFAVAPPAVSSTELSSFRAERMENNAAVGADEEVGDSGVNSRMLPCGSVTQSLPLSAFTVTVGPFGNIGAPLLKLSRLHGRLVFARQLLVTGLPQGPFLVATTPRKIPWWLCGRSKS